MFGFIKRKFKGDLKMTNVSNLKNLKDNSDKARNALEQEIDRINSQLPEGIRLDASGIGLTNNIETLVDLTSNSEIHTGDVLRLVESRDPCLTEGSNYTVVYMDSHGDPQIRDDDGDMHDAGGRAYRHFKKVVAKARQTAEHQWTVLTSDTRDNLQVGDVVVMTHPVEGYSANGVTIGKEYTIFLKPDNDGRFRDDEGNTRDTMEWILSTRRGSMKFRSN